jgi:hypothetical protein
MPYAAFTGDCHVLEKPTPAILRETATDASVRALMIVGYPSASLDEVSDFSQLEVLKIQGAPKLTSLEGTQALVALRELVLATPTGSDGSGRHIAIDSFAPLERLGNLRRLILLHVRPRDLDLSPIMRMSQLEDVDIGGVPELTVEDFARLAMALPGASGRCLAPYCVIPGIGRCGKCAAQQVLLAGAPPRARKWVCPTCNPKLLATHVARWEAVTGTPWTDRLRRDR